MSKKNKHNVLRECKNYARQCGIANNCNNCKNRAMGYFTDRNTGLSRFGVKGCKKKFDINNPEYKRECFECMKEGTEQCSD